MLVFQGFLQGVDTPIHTWEITNVDESKAKTGLSSEFQLTGMTKWLKIVTNRVTNNKSDWLS